MFPHPIRRTVSDIFLSLVPWADVRVFPDEMEAKACVNFHGWVVYELDNQPIHQSAEWADLLLPHHWWPAGPL